MQRMKNGWKSFKGPTPRDVSIYERGKQITANLILNGDNKSHFVSSF